MAASSNKRIFYAVHQVGLKEDGDTGAFTELRAVQSVAMSANFNLTQFYQLGELQIYENQEDLPDLEITLNRLLDGNPLAYHLATTSATTPTLNGRSGSKSIFGMSIFPDTNEYATGVPDSVCQSSGLFVGSHGLNFPLDDAYNEDITLVGNDRVWLNDPKPTATNLPTPSFNGMFSGSSTPPGLGGVNTRQNMIFTYNESNGLDVNGMVADVDTTILPPEVFGISDSGTNEQSNSQDYDAHVGDVSVSVDFGRESINEQGRKGPYTRNISFPVEVTCEVQVTSTSGDMISFTEAGIYTTGTDPCLDGGNLINRTIRIATCEGTRVYLGIKNKLSGTNYSGGDATGGNVSVSYTFTTFNDYTVMHSGDPNANFDSTLLATRQTYLRHV